MPNCKSCRWEYTQSSPEEDMCSTCYDAIMKSKKIKRSTTMKTCKDCAFWENYNDYHGQIEEPIDPDTYRPMDIGFDVKACKSDNITIFERNPNRDGVSLTDGSQYYARMFTDPDYGCVNFKEKTN